MVRRAPLVGPVLAASVLACGGLAPGQSGIRGRVPEGAERWVPATGELVCASRHETTNEPVCAKMRGDGVFELPVPAGTYWLCAKDEGQGELRCSSLCPYAVREGEVTEVDPEDLRAPMPEGQGFHGVSRGSFGERGYLDVSHPLQVCVGPPGTGIHTPTSALTCARTDRCGRYQLSVPEGDYRVLFAEADATTTSERERCLYHVGAGQTIAVDRVTGRGRDPAAPVYCGESGAPDPVIGEELRRIVHEVAGTTPVPEVVSAELVRLARGHLRAGQELGLLASSLQVDEAWLVGVVASGLSSEAQLQERLPPFIATDEHGVAFPRAHQAYADGRVHLHGPNFFDEKGTVTLRPVAGGESFEVADAEVRWAWHEIAFPAPAERPRGRYEVRVTRPNGMTSVPRTAIVELAGAAPAEPDAQECARDPGAPGCAKTDSEARGELEGRGGEDSDRAPGKDR